MNILTAQQLLSKSISNLQTIRGSIYEEEIQTETINVTCKYLLDKYRGQLKQVHDINQINRVIEYNYSLVHNDVRTFVEAVRILYPSQTLSPHPQTGQSWSESTFALIIPNICWAGMWGFLRTYFLRNHRMTIDNVELKPITFSSTRHIRYEQGLKVSESVENRIVQIIFTQGINEVEVSISPSLSPKTGKLHSNNDNSSLYIGDDRDYQFLVKYDEFD
ncbi:hypothetical protein EON78_00445, partial [bacterium]